MITSQLSLDFGFEDTLEQTEPQVCGPVCSTFRKKRPLKKFYYIFILYRTGEFDYGRYHQLGLDSHREPIQKLLVRKGHFPRPELLDLRDHLILQARGRGEQVCLCYLCRHLRCDNYCKKIGDYAFFPMFHAPLECKYFSISADSHHGASKIMVELQLHPKLVRYISDTSV